MGSKSFLFGFAALVAYAFGAWAEEPAPAPQDTREITAVQLPYREPAAETALRPSEGQPRYATMVAPPREETPSGPVAAPTAKVTVAPEGSQAQPLPPSPPRYAAARNDIERVTVTGLRESEDDLYHLGPGDKLHVTVFNETDLSGDFAIDGQGFVRLPLVGPVQAAGLTSFSLEARIADAFIGGGYLLKPRVAVEIVSYRPFYIIGEVAKPGEYPYVNAMSAPNAIALAGGYSDRAVQSTIWLRHQGESKEHEFPADESTRIRPGDVIRVERTTYWAVMTLLAPLISPFATTAYILK
jgi:polysaccharide export outer membrane protein